MEPDLFPGLVMPKCRLEHYTKMLAGVEISSQAEDFKVVLFELSLSVS